jgi:hypothetical protein
MKTNTTAAQVTGNAGKKRAENKDDLDHRKNEEQDFKGDDLTHNSKQTKEKHLQKKK